MTGFTLLELMVALAISAVLLGLAGPPMRTMVLDGKRTETLNALVHTLHLARAQSIREGREITVCPVRDHKDACSGDRSGWGRGWIVFSNADRDQPGDRDPGNSVLLRRDLHSSAQIFSNRASFQYRPFNRRSSNGTLTYCDSRGAAFARAVIVSYTGRPRTTDRDSAGRHLSCPG